MPCMEVIPIEIGKTKKTKKQTNKKKQQKETNKQIKTLNRNSH